MATPYLGEIRMVGFNFAPAGWAFCNGQLLSISNNDALFSLIGTTYGGDGQNTFGLPDLRGRIPVHQGTSVNGSSYIQGQSAGTETVTLLTAQIPAHTHPAAASDGTVGTAQDSPSGAYWSKWVGGAFSTAEGSSSMNAGAIGSIGGGQPHNNLPPYLAVSFVIALVGIFPTRN